jgi:omega-6 fatty acid desaturase (delta-12 desaturase)
MNSTGTAVSTPQRPTRTNTAVWKSLVLPYQKPSLPRAVWQLCNTLVPYAVIWYLMYLSLSWSAWITFGLAVLNGLFLVRIFIIFHDCGHGSFFKSSLANDIVGFITGLLTLTPYHHWRWEHSIHHASCGDLDRRGTGDIWTMTVQEYLSSPPWKRLCYRVARHPVMLFLISPVVLFVFWQRFAVAKASAREKRSVWLMNAAILAMAALLSWPLGITNYLLIHLTIVTVGGGVGIWMFYVQHQFDDVYWENNDSWDYTQAALQGSSFYKLPRVLQWFSGNIGFHHIHHLSPRIPNYNLERCHRANELFQQVKPITLWSSLKLASLRLWDEQQRKLVGWSHLRELRSQTAPSA